VVHLLIPFLMTVAAPGPVVAGRVTTGPVAARSMITGRRGAALERVRLVVLNDEPAAGIRPKGAKVWRSSV
jgi:hypothetical protein